MAKKALVNKCKMEPKYKVRKYHRCRLCGRRRGFIRRFELCRICFRELASKGEIPGIVKASW